MMYELLYNPLSSRGKNAKVARELEKMLAKQDFLVRTQNLLTIKDVDAFVQSLTKDHKVVIIGGDGTLHRIVNSVNLSLIVCEVYLYRAGSGNDFIRSLEQKGQFIKINDYLKTFPTLTTEHGKSLMINGAGIGLDGMVCARVNRSKELKNKSNYFKNALISFFKFKPVSAEIMIDGQMISEKKLWFATTMYAAYFGGGMKIAPLKQRLDGKIQLVLVKDIPRWLLLVIFPTIYLGWHRFFKRFVNIYDANEVSVKITEPSYLQVDGEDQYPVSGYHVIFKDKTPL